MTVVLPVDSTSSFYYSTTVCRFLTASSAIEEIHVINRALMLGLTSSFLKSARLISDTHGGVEVHSSSILAVKHFIPEFIFTLLSGYGLLYSGGTPRAVLHPTWWPARSITCIPTYLEDTPCRVRLFYRHIPTILSSALSRHMHLQEPNCIARGTNFPSCRFQTS